VTGVSRAVRAPRSLTDAELARLLYSSVASCTDSGVDTAAWFPASHRVATARVQAVSAIALCSTCPLRSECLEFSMRYWYRGGEEGVWAGLVGAERLALRRGWLSGESPGELLAGRTPAVRARRLIKDTIGMIRTGGGVGHRPIARKATAAAVTAKTEVNP
jgi:Transcription factor WhiB